MPRFRWHVRNSQIQIFKQYCKKKAEPLHERPGFVFRRLIFFISDLLKTDISLEQIKDGFELIKKMNELGNSSEARDLILDILKKDRNDSPEDS